MHCRKPSVVRESIDLSLRTELKLGACHTAYYIIPCRVPVCFGTVWMPCAICRLRGIDGSYGESYIHGRNCGKGVNDAGDDVYEIERGHVREMEGGERKGEW